MKTPKLYLRDTGLACNLIGLESASDIDFSASKGALFGTAVIEEAAKLRYARGREPKLFFWRDAAGREIDPIIAKGTRPAWAIGAKASATYAPKFFENLDTEAAALEIPIERRVVVYAGDESLETSHGLACSLSDIGTLGP